MRQAKSLINPFYYGKVQDFSQHDLRLLTGFLSGHFRLNEHLWKCNLIESPLCQLCLEYDETAAHILCECVAQGARS